jgi:hypothetical protein
MVRSVRWFALVSLVSLVSCSDPIITEDTRTGCSNHYDDDGDGLVDCADPSCIASGICEVGAAACSNGADDDGNGQTDCQQNTCVAGGYCDSAVTACGVAPQRGCVAGEGCYQASDNAASAAELRCRLAGSRPGVTCSRAAVAALTPREVHPCPAGQGCANIAGDESICANYCNSDSDCPPGGTCQPPPASTRRPGLCTVPCIPTSGVGCPSSSFRCASFHEALAATFAAGGARFLCVPTSIPAGQATVGGACDDPPTLSSPRARVCGAGTACIGLSDGTRCRQICDLAASSCAAGTTCQVLYPSGRPVAYATQRFGACAP